MADLPTYFVGDGIDAFITSAGGVTENSNGRMAFGAHIEHFIEARLTDPATQKQTAVQSCWMHFRMKNASGVGDKSQLFRVFNSGGTELLRILGGPSSDLKLSVWDGASFKLLSSWFVNAGQESAVDVRLDLTKGIVGVYWNQSTVAEVRGLDLAALKDIASFRIGTSTQYSGNFECWQVIAAAYNTIGHTIRTRRPTALGGENGWLGNAAAVGETPLNDSTAISTETPGAVVTFTGPTLTATPEGSTIKAVAVVARARKNGEVAPTSLRAVVKAGNALYEASGNPPLGDGYGPAMSIFPKDPSTGVSWQIAAVNGEFGLKAEG